MQKTAEQGQQEAMAEARAAKLEARKLRCMKHESLASALSMPSALSSLGSLRADFMAPVASASGRTGEDPSFISTQLSGDRPPSRSHPRTPDSLHEGNATMQGAPSLSSGSARNPSRGPKSQRVAGDTPVVLPTVPEVSHSVDVPDDAHEPAHGPAVQQHDSQVPVSCTGTDAGSAIAPVTPPTDVTKPLGQDSQTHLEGMMLSPVDSSASVHAPGTFHSHEGIGAAAAASDHRISSPPQARQMALNAGSCPEEAGSPAALNSKPKGGFFGKFKAKAVEIVQEQRLGQIKRFASQAISDTMAKVERCVSVATVLAYC